MIHPKEMDEHFHRVLRNESVLGKEHAANHRYLNHEVHKLEHEVKSIKEHEHPYWGEKK